MEIRYFDIMRVIHEIHEHNNMETIDELIDYLHDHSETITEIFD